MTDNRADPRLSDDNLAVARSQAGDVDAFNQLVLKYQRGVYNLAYRMLGDTSAAEDITQDAFLSAWRNLERYRGGNFSAWLLRIATNACYDQIRRQQRHPTGSLDVLADDEEAPFELPDIAEGPDDLAIRRELAQAIVVGLQHVHPDQRAAIILVDIHGLSYDEVAVVLDVPIGTIKSRLSRGRAQLRNYFRDHPEQLPEQFRLDL